MLSSNTRHRTPLECRCGEESCSIDISLRWSENQTTTEHFSRLVIERKTSVTCRMNHTAKDNSALSSNTLDFYTRVAPLGLGFLGIPVFYTPAAPLGLKTFTRECYLWKELFRQG